MRSRAKWLLPLGLLVFAALLLSRGLGAVLSTLVAAGWGLLAVALFHAVPLLVDAAAIQVLLHADGAPGTGSIRGAWLSALLARWVGESANSALPAGQIGGPLFMARHLAHRGFPARQAIAAITVSTTFQTVSQLAFALMGLALVATQSGGAAHGRLALTLLGGVAMLGVMLWLFYRLQRQGLFARTARRFGFLLTRGSGHERHARLVERAESVDRAIEETHARAGRNAASLFLSLAGWVVGTGEVYWMLGFLKHPVSWSDALVLESLGQAIRAAGFAVPGALGVQEGGYLLLAPLAGLPPQHALALSLGKRAREVFWALPGLIWWYRTERTRELHPVYREFL